MNAYPDCIWVLMITDLKSKEYHSEIIIEDTDYIFSSNDSLQVEITKSHFTMAVVLNDTDYNDKSMRRIKVVIAKI
jgi:hypothetical protein